MLRRTKRCRKAKVSGKGRGSEGKRVVRLFWEMRMGWQLEKSIKRNDSSILAYQFVNQKKESQLM